MLNHYEEPTASFLSPFILNTRTFVDVWKKISEISINWKNKNRKKIIEYKNTVRMFLLLELLGSWRKIKKIKASRTETVHSQEINIPRKLSLGKNLWGGTRIDLNESKDEYDNITYA